MYIGDIMRLFRSPIKNDGTIRYFELFKMFVFVLFLFGFFSKGITLFKEIDFLSLLSGMILISLMCVVFVYQSYHELITATHLLFEAIKNSLKRIIKAPSLLCVYDFVLNVHFNITYFFRKTEVVYSVFRC